MKIITVCGSRKFKDEMMKVAVEMELAGHVMLIPIFPVNGGEDEYTKEELAMLGRMHKEKIKLSDAILVVNVNGYVGNSTKSEIEFAKSIEKDVIYYMDLMRCASLKKTWPTNETEDEDAVTEVFFHTLTR